MQILGIFLWIGVWILIAASPLVIARRWPRFYLCVWFLYVISAFGFLTHFFTRLYLYHSKPPRTFTTAVDPEINFYFSHPMILPLSVTFILYLLSGWGLPRFAGRQRSTEC